MVLDRVDSYGREIERTGEVASALSLESDVTIRMVYVADQAWRHEDTPFLNNVRREGRAA